MTGFFHFYALHECNEWLQEKVSMPYDGLFSFLQKLRKRYPEAKIGVNAL